MIQLKFIIFIYYFSTTFCLPVDNTINNQDIPLENNDLKNVLSVDQILNSPNNKNKLQEETTTSIQLFNNNEPEEDKIYKINDPDEPIESNLSPQSKQQSSGMPNVQSLIEQTNTISMNLENMIKDMTQNKRHATATMLRLMLQNVRRLNASLVRLNNRINSLPIIGNSQGSASSSGTSSSVSNSVSNATYTAASSINTVVSNIRNQLNSVSNEINNLLQRIRLSMPGSGNKPATTPSG